jgi:SLOG cluster3 family
VVALARACLTAGFRLVTAAHPTVAPLLLYVAAEFPAAEAQRVIVYQSELFEDVLPSATRRFEADGIGSLIWTAAAKGDRPEPGHWEDSLAIMRARMLEESNPVAACFIGGMEGILQEFSMFTRLFPGRPTYPIGRPGGEARGLASNSPSPLAERLLDDGIYPALCRSILAEVDSSH